MADAATEVAPAGEGDGAGDAVDGGRIKSYLGISLARVGPKAHGILTGTFLVLLVADYTSSAFLITFAVTAHRLLYWLSLPLIGRLSDRSDTRLGRRVPFMAGGMLLLAVCTWFYPTAPSYGVLVLLLVIARQGSITSSITGQIAIAEIFGRSRWVKAVAAVFVAGLLVTLSVRGTVVATWVDSDPSTWASTFRVGAVWMAVAALATVLFVRESDDATDAPQPAVPDSWRDHLHDFDDVPNGRRLALGLALLVFGLSATGRLFPVYATDALGATASDLALLPVLVVPVQIVSVWLGLRLSSHLGARRLIALAGVGSLLITLAHFVITALWQYVLLGGLLSVLFTAAAVPIVPMVLQLLPRSGRIGERLGLIVAPVAVAGVVGAWASGALVDVFDEIRLIWVVPTIVSIAWAASMPRLEMLHPDEQPDLGAMFRRAMAATADGQQGKLFKGEVAASDIDPTVGLHAAQDATNPYVASITLLDERDRLIEWTRRLLRLGVASDSRRAELLDAIDDDVILVRGDRSDVLGATAVVAAVDDLHSTWGHPKVVEGRDGGVAVAAERRLDGMRQHVTATFVDERIVRIELADVAPSRSPIAVDLTSGTARSGRDRRTFSAVARHLVRQLLSRGGNPAKRTAVAAPRLRRLADKLGGVYARFAATVAADPARAGESLADAFAECTDVGPPLRRRTVRAIIEAETAQPLGASFTAVDDEPVRATATTVVHAARTIDGTTVEITLIRPEVHDDASVDLTALSFLTSALFAADPAAAGVIDVVRDLRDELAIELDLRNEAEASPAGVLVALSSRAMLTRAVTP